MTAYTPSQARAARRYPDFETLLEYHAALGKRHVVIEARALCRGIALGDPVVTPLLELLLQRRVGDPIGLVALTVDPHRLVACPDEYFPGFPA